jgi:hypothetical protein
LKINEFCRGFFFNIKTHPIKYYTEYEHD